MTQKTAKNQNREGKAPIPIVTKRPRELPEGLHWDSFCSGSRKGQEIGQNLQMIQSYLLLSKTRVDG